MASGGQDDGKKRGKTLGQSGRGNAVADAPFRGYINVVLDADDKTAFEGWSQSEEVWGVLEQQVSAGVGVALKPNSRDGGFLASATQRDVTSPNAGLCVTARGRTALLSLLRLLFILTVLDQGEKWEDTQPMADPDRW